MSSGQNRIFRQRVGGELNGVPVPLAYLRSHWRQITPETRSLPSAVALPGSAGGQDVQTTLERAFTFGRGSRVLRRSGADRPSDRTRTRVLAARTQVRSSNSFRVCVLNERHHP
jgi:hypothetical protein